MRPCGAKHLHPQTRSGLRLGGDGLASPGKVRLFHVRTDFLRGTGPVFSVPDSCAVLRCQKFTAQKFWFTPLSGLTW